MPSLFFLVHKGFEKRVLASAWAFVQISVLFWYLFKKLPLEKVYTCLYLYASARLNRQQKGMK
jgi:hypothetical protein